MKLTSLFYTGLFFILINLFFVRCSDEPVMMMEEEEMEMKNTPPATEVPDPYFTWTIDGVESVSDQDYISANTFGEEMIIGGATGSSVTGDFVFLRINNGNSEFVMSGSSFTMDSDSDDEITLRFPDDTEWSTSNPGGEGFCTITSYQEYNDVLFTTKYIEGTFMATLTSETESGTIVINGGTFGAVELR